MIIITQTIGIDIGGYIKFSCGEKKIAIPNVIGSPTPGWSGFASDTSWINNLVLIKDEDEYYIGDLARLQSDTKHFIMDQGKLDKLDEVFMLIKSVLPILSDEEDQDLVLGIGVPLSTDINKMKELSSKLKGSYTIKIKNESTKEIIEVEKNIKKALVMPESYGSYYYQVSKFDGRVVNAQIISLDLLTEIMTIIEGRIIRNASVNLVNASLFTLANKITHALQHKTNRIINPLSIIKNLKDEIDGVIISGKKYDIGEIKEHYIKQISNEIVDNIKRAINFIPLDVTIEYY
ncbi:MAG: ParM/StbA family protein, partial [Promethearchaeota archaeon]